MNHVVYHMVCTVNILQVKSSDYIFYDVTSQLWQYFYDLFCLFYKVVNGPLCLNVIRITGP